MGILAGGGFPQGLIGTPRPIQSLPPPSKSKLAKQSGALPHFEGGGKLSTLSKNPGWWPVFPFENYPNQEWTKPKLLIL